MPEQTHLTLQRQFRQFWRFICIQEITKIQQTTTENIQIYGAMYFVFLTTPTKRDSINLQRTLIFIYMQKINFIPSFLHEILQLLQFDWLEAL